MDSETNVPSDSDYNEFANEILFVGIFTAAEIPAKRDLAGTSAQSGLVPTSQNFMHNQLTRWHSWSKAERWMQLFNSKNVRVYF